MRTRILYFILPFLLVVAIFAWLNHQMRDYEDVYRAAHSEFDGDGIGPCHGTTEACENIRKAILKSVH